MTSLSFPQIEPPTVEQALKVCVEVTIVEEGSSCAFVIYINICMHFYQRVEKVVILPFMTSEREAKF